MVSFRALEGTSDMVRYVPMALKIGVHSPFGPKFPVEFVAFNQKILPGFRVLSPSTCLGAVNQEDFPGLIN